MESSDACQIVKLTNCEAVAARHYHVSKTQHLILIELITLLSKLDQTVMCTGSVQRG
jgi:hypothetical protein